MAGVRHHDMMSAWQQQLPAGVLQRMPQADLVARAPAVCRAWRAEALAATTKLKVELPSDGSNSVRVLGLTSWVERHGGALLELSISGSNSSSVVQWLWDAVARHAGALTQLCCDRVPANPLLESGALALPHLQHVRVHECGDGISTAPALAQLPAASLCTLHFVGSDLDRVALSQLSRLTALQELSLVCSLSSIDIEGVLVEHLPAAMRPLTALTCLVLNLTPTCTATLRVLLPALPRLSQLSLRRCFDLDSEALDVLTMLEVASRLRSLDLTSVKCFEAAKLRGLSRLTALRELTLDETDADDSVVAALSAGGPLMQLCSLSLGGAQCALPVTTALTRLDLSSCSQLGRVPGSVNSAAAHWALGGAALLNLDVAYTSTLIGSSLLPALPALSGLTRLEMGLEPVLLVENLNANALASAVAAHCPRLADLGLGGHGVGDPGVAALASGLAAQQGHLTRLDLSVGLVTLGGVAALGQGMTALRELALKLQRPRMVPWTTTAAAGDGAGGGNEASAGAQEVATGRALAAVLPVTLRKLDLYDNGLGWPGGREVLRVLTRLEELHLGLNLWDAPGDLKAEGALSGCSIW